MIKTEAQNQYFEALNAIANTGQDDIKIDSLLDNMFAEFDHNIIELSYKNSYDLLTIIGKRFNTVKKNRLFENDHALKFKKLLDSRAKEVTLKSFKGINKYGIEISPSGLIIPKQKPENLSDEFKESSKTNSNSKMKLKWKGNKTQMYHVIRQLKSNDVLISSYEDIGLFLIQSIDKFEGSDLGTVINELQKKKPAHRSS